jgi:hypothetical protein
MRPRLPLHMSRFFQPQSGCIPKPGVAALGGYPGIAQNDQPHWGCANGSFSKSQDATPSGLLTKTNFSQGSREARQPWALWRDRVAVVGKSRKHETGASGVNGGERIRLKRDEQLSVRWTRIALAIADLTLFDQ